MRKSHPCEGPNLDSTGNRHCPLAAIISDAYALVACRPAPIAILPETVIEAGQEYQQGQYLCGADSRLVTGAVGLECAARNRADADALAAS